MRAQSWTRTPLVWRLMALKLSWSYFWNGTGFSLNVVLLSRVSALLAAYDLSSVFSISFSPGTAFRFCLFLIYELKNISQLLVQCKFLCGFYSREEPGAQRFFHCHNQMHIHSLRRSGLAWKQMIDVGVSCRHGISWDGRCDSLQPLWLGFWDKSWRLECTVDYWENSGGGWFRFHLWRGGRVWNCKGLKYRVFNMLHLFWKAYRGWIHNGSFTLL